MIKQAEITYLFNSGFTVELGDKLLVFDYFQDSQDRVSALLETGKTAYVFASHGHFDHFNADIANFAKQTARYFLSFDLRGASGVERLPTEKITYMDAYAAFSDEEIKVTTFSSTDEGVSFLVELDGWRIFHAGDFNWWHWKGDTQENILLAKNAFMKQMKKLDGLRADIAFFPVDKRMEEFCDIGAKEFCCRTKIHYLITMHNTQHSPWRPAADFPTEESMISVWTPEKPGETLRIIK